ncbi:hypothetical protein M422DRAFT_249528 [Sphaerobolus stellatus SS14]|uniref:Uncharacterized protein n=1 Tax=Sphaerobolus stellatus (strain SS14) TaxID=990650 RepID=A0A0C9W508_SPHS4|nr:hypothetical protein M422DRAFT_249528 [Sphaerobolus stellatus SS14]
MMILSSNIRTEEYPLGTHPSWHEITDILYTNPTLIVNTHSNLQFWQSGNCQIHHIVIQLLCKWTHNYTCTINPILLTEPENYPQPENWHDILNFWTVNQIQETFHAPAFLPHKSHWKGLPDGPKQLSFGERFKSFFPPLEADFLTGSAWHLLKGIGYLKDYHTFLSTKSEHDILCLQDGLKAAFELLECLPDKKISLQDEWCWPSQKEYQYTLSKSHSNPQRIEALLLADNLNISFNDATKHIKGNNRQAQKQDRHSAKHKNKRKPPQKIQRSQGSSANENQEIQPEHLEEDSEEVNGDSIQKQEQDYSEEDSDYFNIESEDSEEV